MRGSLNPPVTQVSGTCSGIFQGLFAVLPLRSFDPLEVAMAILFEGQILSFDEEIKG